MKYNDAEYKKALKRAGENGEGHPAAQALLAAQERIDFLEAQYVHTCHSRCPRPACVEARKTVKELSGYGTEYP